MAANDLAFTSAAELATLIRAKRISATEVMRATLARAGKAQAALNCFITICADAALRDAEAADAAVARGGALGPLHGVPFHVKDLVNTKDVRTTFASHMYEHNVPKEDSVSVARLKQAGAILMGKTTTPEFGHICPTPRRRCSAARATPGRPTAPAAARRAARRWRWRPASGPIGIGTDAGGSTPHPRGRQRRRRLQAVRRAWCRTTCHRRCSPTSPASIPMARTVMDTALMLEAMAGQHPSDPYSYGAPSTGFVAAARPEGST